MPTGYTATLMDKGQDFRTFALGCARAFGACIMQRDDPMDRPPEKQEASEYHVKAVKEAQDTLANLKAMSAEQQRQHGLELRQKAVDSARASLVRSQEQQARLDRMAAQVRAWNPPTGEHNGLKDFMLDQIKISGSDGTWSENWLKQAEDKPAEAYFVEAVSGAVRDVAYHIEEQRKEQERTDGRNKWIEDLNRSLP